MEKKQTVLLRACGALLAALNAANPHATANWRIEFVRSPKLRLGQYVTQLSSAGLSESADEKISAAADKIDVNDFSILPDTLPEEMQGIVWLGYYASKDFAAEWTPDKLREAFNASGMTQQELAEVVGIGQGRLSEHLSGKTTPRPALRRKYEQALGLAPGTLG